MIDTQSMLFSHNYFCFHHRLSRARRVIKNAFGILAGRWRLFRKPIIVKPENVEVFKNDCIVLHNFLLSTDKKYADTGYGNYFAADGSAVEGG